ncbi:MAG: TraR/DksA family transcriptional regulator [Gammaproteobacteria bacterium]|nr:TraR/DksA family transcriptional regulator [Gammaproteobacteria bacterium]MBT3723177.1 TraR/DksA family transcriptional regulator [Gammaproteobacteria bacterium]MBT4077899.1 TraR/DksA family transcriptional regulator [Gammaproteobacteria bacterium]MBT4193708.1 TraR/DksA family transcriptional regulator [Gammaproteobacteria bacterium]MBT4450111.1 TraR/DksA family transcriptional regulator [Gammaproteobacteria bacterium]
MNNNNLEQMKNKLLQQRVELEELEASYLEDTKPVELDQSKVGRLSRMDAMQGQQLAMEAARRRKLQLMNIEAALRRIQSDEFGYCLECGEEIDNRRLEFDPANSLCIECAEKSS